MNPEPALAPTPLVRAAGSSAENRCPYCHDDVPGTTVLRFLTHDERARLRNCAACRAVHHAECWTEGGGCSACGRTFAPETIPTVASLEPPATLDRPPLEPRARDASRPRPRLLRRAAAAAPPTPRSRALSLGMKLLVAAPFALLLLNVVGTGFAHLLCRSERARIEERADAELAQIAERRDLFEFTQAPASRGGRRARLTAGAREVAKKRAQALDELASEYGALASVPHELPWLRERVEGEKARVRGELTRELRALEVERTSARSPVAPDRAWAEAAEARAREDDEDLDSIAPAYESAVFYEAGNRAREHRGVPHRWWPAWWHFAWPGE